MEHAQRVIAGELALALKWGEANLEEAIEWADGLISSMEIPDDDLTEVSLASSNAEAITALHSLSAKVQEWEIISALLQRLAQKTSMLPREASQLAKRLYHLKMEKDAPKFLSAFCGHWDEIDLAIDGVYGDVDSSVEAFLADLKEAARLSITS